MKLKDLTGKKIKIELFQNDKEITKEIIKGFLLDSDTVESIEDCIIEIMNFMNRLDCYENLSYNKNEYLLINDKKYKRINENDFGKN